MEALQGLIKQLEEHTALVREAKDMVWLKNYIEGINRDIGYLVEPMDDPEDLEVILQATDLLAGLIRKVEARMKHDRDKAARMKAVEESGLMEDMADLLNGLQDMENSREGFDADVLAALSTMVQDCRERMAGLHS